MKVSRPCVVIGAVVIVAGMVAGLTLWAVADDSPKPAVDEALLLTNSDLRADYAVEGIDRYSESRRPTDVTPASCQRVLADQFERNNKAQTVRVRIASGVVNTPTYTHTVDVGGQSVYDTLDVVRSCPQYSEATPDGRLSVSQWIVPEPEDCNARVTYIRYSLTQQTRGAEPERADSIAAFMQRGSTVSSVLRSGAGEPDAEFCRLVGLANEKLFATGQ